MILEITRLVLNETTKDDIGKPVLYKNHGWNEYGVIAGFSKLGIFVHFGMNEEPLLIRGKELYFVTFKQ